MLAGFSPVFCLFTADFNFYARYYNINIKFYLYLRAKLRGRAPLYRGAVPVFEERKEENKIWIKSGIFVL